MSVLSAETSVMNCFPSLCAEEQLVLQDYADSQGKLACLYSGELPLLTSSISPFMDIVISLLYLQAVMNLLSRYSVPHS